jgi:hypothetical protein
MESVLEFGPHKDLNSVWNVDGEALGARTSCRRERARGRVPQVRKLIAL